MNKNPYLNGAFAFLYVALVGTFLQNARYFFGEKDPAFIPIMMISLFVLSAAVMGYLFILLPLQLYFDGHKKQAVDAFFYTMGTFAVFTVAIWILAAIVR